MKKHKNIVLFIFFTIFIVTSCSSPIKEGTNNSNSNGTVVFAPNEPHPSSPKAVDEGEEVSEEYLFITMTSYTNGSDDTDGVNLLLYRYDIVNKQLSKQLDIPIHTTFPANCIDVVNQKIYYAGANKDETYDNLFVYDMVSEENTQLTYGKYAFDDILLIDGTLYVNTARQYATVCQPAIFDIDTGTFTYLDPDDDDTWHHSMSYNYSTGKLLILTCSNSEMRTHRVAAETHIRPKTISFLDKSLKNKEKLFFTEDFEIRLTRQLDENHILMTVDPFMGSTTPRTLKMLTINTQEITDFNIPGIKSVYLFDPRDNGEGVFFIGKEDLPDSKWWLYYYDIANETVTEVLQTDDVPDNFRALVNIQYSIQPAPKN